MPKEKKQSWDEKRLLHFNGRCILGLAALILLGALFTLLEIDWLVALSWVAFAALIVWMISSIEIPEIVSAGRIGPRGGCNKKKTE